jgi:hypothetical protein
LFGRGHNVVCENPDQHPSLPTEHCTLAPNVKTGDVKRIYFFYRARCWPRTSQCRIALSKYLRIPKLVYLRTPKPVARLCEAMSSITVNEVTGNPFQPNVQFRGFVASPVAGTPQGLAVYQNGVRINEAFGDTVNWDLIPTAAIKSVTVLAM